MAQSKDFIVKNGLVVQSTATIQSAQQAVSSTSGAFIVTGGVGVGLDMWVAGNIYSGGIRVALATASVATITAGTDTAVNTSTGFVVVWNTSTLQSITNRGATTTNVVYLQNTTSATSTTTGALVVAGGVGIGGSVYVGNNLTVNGSVTFNGTATYVYSTNTVYTDNIIELHTPPGGVTTQWTQDDGRDVGLRFHYYSGGDQNAALVLANDTKYLEFYNTGAEGTSSTIVGATYGTFKTAAIILTGTATSISTQTGALQVAGGVAITKDLFVGGSINVQGSISGSITTATNIANGTIGQVPFQQSTGTTLFFGPGTAGQILLSAGASATGPVYTNTSSIMVNAALYAGTSTNIAGGAAGQLHYQSSPGITAFVNTGSAGNLLVSAGSGQPVFTNTTTFIVGYSNTASFANSATNIAGGAPGFIPIQSNTGTTAFITTGTVGYVLQMQSGNTATWVTPSTFASSVTVAATPPTTSTNGQLWWDSTIGNLRIYYVDADSGQWVDASGGSVITTSIQTGNILGGAANQIVYQSTSSSTAFISAPTTASTFLVWTGSGFAWGAGGAFNTSTAVAYAVTSTYSTTSSNALNLIGGTAGQLPYQTGPGATSFFGPGNVGQILIGNGAGAPVFVNSSTFIAGYAVNANTSTYAATAYTLANTGTFLVGYALTATNLSSGAQGSLPYQTGVGATSMLALGSSGYVLTAGATAPQWTAIGSLSAGITNTATNLAGGLPGQIPYQLVGGATTFSSTGTVGYIAVSSGTNGIAYQNTSSFLVGYALNLINTSTTQVGIATTASFAGIAYSTIASHTAGTGLTGTAFNGGTAQTWTLNTSTLIASAVTATFASTAYTLANTGTFLVGYALNLINTATTQVGYAFTATQANAVSIVDDTATATPQYLSFVTSNQGYSSVKTSSSKLTYVPSTGFITAPGLYISGTSASTATTSSNALYVAGGAYLNSLFVKNDTTFGGNVTFNGTATYVYSTQTAYTDNLIELHTPPGGVSATWPSDDGKDIGLRIHYYSGGDQNAALVLANDTKYLEWYSAGAEASTGTFNSATYGTFKTGAIVLMNTTTAINTFSGSLQLQGGAGIGRDLYVGGNLTVLGTINASIAGVISTATSLANGTAGQIPYQTGPGVTSFFGPGSAGNILVSNGTGTPGYVSSGTFLVGYALNLINTSTTQVAIATTATFASTAYTLANTGTFLVGYALNLINTSTTQVAIATTATYASTAYTLANTSSFLVGYALNATTATYAATAYSVAPLTGTLIVNNATASTTTASGAVQVQGGVGIGGNINVGPGATNRSLLANAYGNSFTTAGDSQYVDYILNTATVTGVSGWMTSNRGSTGTTNQIVLPNNSAYGFYAMVTARDTTFNNMAVWRIEGGIKRGASAGTTVLVGVPVVTRITYDTSATNWAVVPTADITNGALAFGVKGSSATNIRWVANIRTIEVA